MSSAAPGSWSRLSRDKRIMLGSKIGQYDLQLSLHRAKWAKEETGSPDMNGILYFHARFSQLDAHPLAVGYIEIDTGTAAQNSDPLPFFQEHFPKQLHGQRHSQSMETSSERDPKLDVGAAGAKVALSGLKNSNKISETAVSFWRFTASTPSVDDPIPTKMALQWQCGSKFESVANRQFSTAAWIRRDETCPHINLSVSVEATPLRKRDKVSHIIVKKPEPKIRKVIYHPQLERDEFFDKYLKDLEEEMDAENNKNTPQGVKDVRDPPADDKDDDKNANIDQPAQTEAPAETGQASIVLHLGQSSIALTREAIPCLAKSTTLSDPLLVSPSIPTTPTTTPVPTTPPPARPPPSEQSTTPNEPSVALPTPEPTPLPPSTRLTTHPIPYFSLMYL